jgi:iron complex transport system substrate-binding protein
VRQVTTSADRPRVVALEWLDPPFVGGHWLPEMIAIAGGEDVAGPPGAKSPEVRWEDLEALDPDVVLVIPCGYYLEGARAQANEFADRITALGADRVFAIDAASTFSRPGPRLVDGLEVLAHLFHPKLVPAPPGIEFADVSPAQSSRS